MARNNSIDSFLKNNSTFDNKLLAYIDNNPHNFLIALAIIIGFFLRLFASLMAKGIIHPDEIFQGVEMAHLIVYDSGKVPPEFQKDNPTTPSYAASRSWIFPLILSLMMRFGEFLGLNYYSGTLILMRIFFALNATLLIPASSKLAKQLTASKNVGVTVAIVVSSYWRLIEYTIRPLTNTFFLPMLIYGIYRVLLNLEKSNISIRDHIIVIICIGIPTYVRLDLIVIIFSFFIVTFHIKYLRLYLDFLIDGIIAWLIGAQIDYYYYGKFFTVPINWFKFNILEHNSDWFGLKPSSYYIRELIYKDGLTIWLVLLLLSLISRFLLMRNKQVILTLDKDFKKLEFGFLQLFVSSVFTWIIFSSFWRGLSFSSLWNFLVYQESWNPQSHKEIRFIIAGLVLLVITISTSFVYIANLITAVIIDLLIKNKKIKVYHKIEFRHWSNLFFVIFLISALIIQSVSISPTRYHAEQFVDSNRALSYVGQQSDVSGVIVISAWYHSGSYYYSHLNSDIELRYVNFNEDNITKYENYKQILLFLLKTWFEGNYLIFPRYQSLFFSKIWDWLRENNWVINLVIDGKTEIWKRG